MCVFPKLLQAIKKYTMKNLILIIFLSYNVFQSTHSANNHLLNQVKNKYLDKYMNHNVSLEFCPGFEEKLEQALVSSLECQRSIDHSLTLCQIFQKYTINCTRPIVAAIEDCLAPEAKGLPSLAIKSFLSVLDHFCKQTGEDVLELANPCLWKSFKEPNKELNDCENRLENLENLQKKYSVKPPTQSETCSTVTSFRSCVEHVPRFCKNVKTRKAFLGLYDAIIAPCNNNN